MHHRAYQTLCTAEERRNTTATTPIRRTGLTLFALALGTFAIEFGSNEVSVPVATHAITAYAFGVVIGSPAITLLADGAHPWPGGRRHPGESYADTAVREVHEETGWSLDRGSLRPLGWLHLEHLAPRRPNDHYPLWRPPGAGEGPPPAA